MVKYCEIHATQPARALGRRRLVELSERAGMYSSEEAKMTGTTPAMLTLIGMYVFVPP